MRIPTRKSENKAIKNQDPFITQTRYDDLLSEHERLEKKVRPRLATEVARLAELGDFSENAEYQIAKGKLRGLNRRLLEIENILKYSQIIQTDNRIDKVRLGHRVTVMINEQVKTFKILGSSETNPGQGVISQNSPIGEALLGEKVGETVEVKLVNGKINKYKILKIEN